MAKRWKLYTASTLALTLALAGCSSTGNSGDSASKEGGEGSDEKKVLNLSTSSDIPTMDSSLATDQVSFYIMNQTQEGLYRLGEDDKAVDGIAEGEPEVSEDSKKYTFKLREDAKWSNGDPVTAKDFEYGWKRTLDPETASEYGYIMYDIKNAEAVNTGKKKVDELGIKAVDDYTLEVELEKPLPYFKELLTFATFYPLNEKYVEEQGDKFGTTEEKTLYNGPFELTDWETESKFKLVPNEEYWDKEAVKLDEVNFQVVKDPQTAINLYETGKIDIVGLSAEHVDNYKEDPNFNTELRTSTFFMRFNQNDEIMANKNVRLAINKAIDREKYVKSNLNNGSVAYDKLTPKEFVKGPDEKDYVDGVESELAYDLEGAKEAWEKAKKELGKDEIEIELLTYDSETSKTDAEYFQAQLQKNLDGLSLKIKQQPFKQKLALESKGDYQLSFAGWGPDYPDPMTFVDMFVTDGAHNQMEWSNSEFDKLVKDAKGELADKPEERWAAMQEAENILLEDAAIMPMYQAGAAYLQQPYIKNYQRHKFGADMTFKHVDIEGKE